jgi:hypothetical protein
MGQYAALLTYAALDPADTFTTAELHAAMDTLPQDGLQEAAQTLVYALGGAGEQRGLYWENRIQPYWQKIWPKSRRIATSQIAEQLTRLSIAARESFPEVLDTVCNWLQPIEHPHYVTQLLHESRAVQPIP